jgi:hypothetical protein
MHYTAAVVVRCSRSPADAAQVFEDECFRATLILNREAVRRTLHADVATDRLAEGRRKPAS